MGRILRMAAGAACVLVLVVGCASPAARHDRLAARLGLERGLLHGADHEHVLYARPAAPGRPLHIYFDGDGTPWLHGRWPAPDPTPREMLGLTLAGLDPAGLYLGRPCYLGAGGRVACTPTLWTDSRYGGGVVESLAGAVRRLRDKRRPEQLVLVGYSGGGTLAMLVAERVRGIDAVVTIAANLDVAGWAAHHGYVPLEGSLDPARRAPLPAAVRQVHLVGDEDENVPPALVAAVAARQPAARVLTLAGYDHRCCWADSWPALLQAVLAPVE